MSRSSYSGSKENEKKLKIKYHKQVCIYAFNSEELKIYGYNKKSNLEKKLEDIEILRFFEINKKIKMVKTSSGSLAVDQKKDIKKIEKLLKSYDFLNLDEYDKLVRIIKKLPLPKIPKIHKDDLLPYILKDKKNEKNKLNFVVLNKLGNAITTDKITHNKIVESFKLL